MEKKLVRMPLSVMCAICEKINQSMPAQMAAAHQWIDMGEDFIEILANVVSKIPDEATRYWILDELYEQHESSDDNPSDEPIE